MAKLGKSQREKDTTQVVSIAAFKDGKLLLGLRNDDASWNLPGGHVEPGEDPTDAAKREFQEETGMRVAMQNLIPVGYSDVRDGLRVHFFRADVVHGEPHAGNDPDEEMAAFKWVDPENIPKSILSNLHNKQDVALQFLDIQDPTLDLVWDDVAMAKAAPKFWRTKDGVKIPAMGTPEHEDYNKKFFEALNHHFGEGRGNKLKPLQVPVDKLYGHNMPVNKERLKLYTRMLRAGHPVPPVVVKRSGNAFTLVDGNHRHAAAQATNQQMLNAFEVVEGPKMKKDELSPERIDIAKGLMGAVAGIALATSPMHKPDGHDQKMQDTAMHAIKQHVNPWSPDGLHEDLHGIAHLESSFGKKTKHAAHSKGEYHTAVGAVGLKPITAHEEYKRTKTLQQLYPNLNDPAEFTKKLQTDHKFYNHVASAHWARLKNSLKSATKAAFAWRWGASAAHKADPEQILSDPYVQKYNALSNQLVMKSEDAVVLLKNEAEDEIMRMLAHPDPHEASLALKMNGVTPAHVKHAASHSNPDVVAAALAHPLSNEEIFRHAMDVADAKNLPKMYTDKFISAFSPKLNTVNADYWDSYINDSPKYRRFLNSTLIENGSFTPQQINTLLDKGGSTVSYSLPKNPGFNENHVTNLFNKLHGINDRRKAPDFDDGVDYDFGHNPRAKDWNHAESKENAETAIYHVLNNKQLKLPEDINHHILGTKNSNIITHALKRGLPGLDDAALQWAVDPERQTAEWHDHTGNAVLKHLLLSNKEIAPHYMDAIMSNPKLSGAQLHIMQSNPNLHPDLIQKFINAHDTDASDSMHIVARYPGLTPDQANYLARHHDKRTRADVVAHHASKLAPDTVDRLMTDSDPTVRSNLYQHRQLSPQQITSAINDPTTSRPALQALGKRKDLDSTHIHDLINNHNFPITGDFFQNPNFGSEHIQSLYSRSLARNTEEPFLLGMQYRSDLIQPEHIDAALTLSKHLGSQGNRLGVQIASSKALMPRHVNHMLKRMDDMYFKESAFVNLLQNPAFSKDHLAEVVKNPQPWQVHMLGNSQHINHPDVLPHLLNGPPSIRQYAYHNPNMTHDQLRWAWNKEKTESPHNMDYIVRHSNVPDDILEEAMKQPFTQKTATEVYHRHRPDLKYTESVHVKPGTGMLRHIRDQILASGKKEIHPKEVQGWDGKSGRTPNGMISAQKIQEAIDDTLPTKFHISHSQYGHEYEPNDEDADTNGYEDGEWDISYDQRHTPEPSKVLHLNITGDHIAKMKGAGVYETFLRLQDAHGHQGLQSTPHSVAWVRYTGTPKEGIHIDEMQSDHHVPIVKKLESQYKRNPNDPHIKQSLQSAEMKYPVAHQKIINKILFGSRSGMEVAHEALRQHLRDQGHHDTVIHVPSSDIKRKMSLRQDGPVPPHMKETYDEVPEKRYAMKPAKYGELDTQSNRNLHGQPTRAGKVLKNEED